MTDDGKSIERVTFSRGVDVCIMAIDGTWRRDCQLNAISDNDAALTVEGSIQGLNLKEFFLLLSSTGLAYRRCELVRVNGTEMDISGAQAPTTSGSGPDSRKACPGWLGQRRPPIRTWNGSLPRELGLAGTICMMSPNSALAGPAGQFRKRAGASGSRSRSSAMPRPVSQAFRAVEAAA